MDVGAPSNFERLAAHWNVEELRKMIKGVWITDEATRAAIAKVNSQFGYILDPHGAVGWAAAEFLLKKNEIAPPVAVLETAHPYKFLETVGPIVGNVPAPPQLLEAEKRTINSVVINASLDELRGVLHA
jgi:threonine synthase